MGSFIEGVPALGVFSWSMIPGVYLEPPFSPPPDGVQPGPSCVYHSFPPFKSTKIENLNPVNLEFASII